MRRCVLLILTLLLFSPAFGQEDPVGLNVYHGEIPAGERTFFVAPDGDNEAAGTEEEPWASLDYAVTQVERGDVIVVRGGVYEHDDTIRIETPSGFTDDLIVVTAYPGEVPILDFSLQPKERNYHGIRLNANWWHLIGLTIRNASHNGIRMDGGYNVLEQLTAYGNHDSGIHMAGGASYNLIKNSDSFRNFNYDTNRTPRIGNNADGFSAKFDIGPGNRYVGCRSWENSDDGWDFWEAESTIIIDSSWAFGNGDASVFDVDPQVFEGNGNGFKLGGGNPAPYTPHVVRYSMAFDNFGSSGNAKGFDYNSNPAAMTLLHNTAYNNGRNYYFPINPPEGQAVFLNNLSAETSLHAQLPLEDVLAAGNSWQSDTEVNTDILLSVDTEAAKGPREPDGSLPAIDLLKPTPESFLVDGGLAIGEPFYGAAPDMGAFERESGERIQPWVDRGSGTSVTDLRVFDLENAAQWSIVDDLETGDDAYGGSDETLIGLPADLEVYDWIRPAAASRTKNYLFKPAELILLRDAFVLVAHPDAVTEKPAWLAAYTETDAAIGIAADGIGERWLTIYQREAAAGDTIKLGRNSLDGHPNALMYLAMVGGPANVAAEDPHVPVAAAFEGIYPNPVADAATIAFRLDRPSDVTIRIYDALGREVALLASGHRGAGRHAARWDAAAHPAGVYYCHFATESFTDVRTIVRVQ